ncbi:MAG: hypothetical protein P8Y17_00140 [Patescibacteria group bacterium]
MAKIGIVGWGVVGQATGKAFAKVHEVLWNDPAYKDSTPLPKLIKESEYIFICVPTPMFSDESGIDLSIVKKVVKQITPKIKGTNKVLIIKSSVTPGTTLSFANKYPKVNFAMNPEFLTEINAPRDFIYTDRIVIGVLDEGVGVRIAKLHRDILGYKVKIFLTDPTSAELAKYMSNTFMATKVIFANEMNQLAEKLNINYDDIKDMVAADRRIEESFFKVTPFKGFGGKCFPKDTVALLGLARKLKVDLSLLETAWKKNLKLRKIRDWEEIPGAVKKRRKRSKKL